MYKRVSITFDPEWVIAFCGIQEPVKTLVSIIGDSEFSADAWIFGEYDNGCLVVLRKEGATEQEAEAFGYRILERMFGFVPDGPIHVMVEEVGEDGEPNDTADLILDEPVAQPPKPPAVKAIDLIQTFSHGDFRLLADEITRVAPLIKANGTQDMFLKRCYLFAINDEYSFIEHFKLLLGHIKETGIFRSVSTVIHHAKFYVPTSQNPNPLDELTHAVQRRRDEEKVHLMSIDISEWMSKTDDPMFYDMLAMIERNNKNIIFAFRIPFVEREVFDTIRANIGDVLTLKALSIPPMSIEDLVDRTEGELKQYGYDIDAEARNVLAARFREEKSESRFYGIITMRKVANQTLYQKHLHDAACRMDTKLIKGIEILKICSEDTEDERSGMEMLEDFVGIDAIRDRMMEIISQIEMSVKTPGLGAPCIHMRFVGNPGTGKTTIARVLGKILKEKGVLRNGSFFEHTGREFCGRFVGETAPKTASMCRDAYGSVLFIDEAYTLYTKRMEDSHDFGREALDTLVSEMENHRNDLLVIMAGYPDEMQELMNGNRGLESRMPYLIEFPNYTREQLAEQFMRLADKHFEYDDGLPDAVSAYFDALPDEVLSSKTFSNARYVRNLFERTWGKAVLRGQLDREEEIILTREDFEAASADHEFKNKDTKKTRHLGFT